MLLLTKDHFNKFLDILGDIWKKNILDFNKIA